MQLQVALIIFHILLVVAVVYMYKDLDIMLQIHSLVTLVEYLLEQATMAIQIDVMMMIIQLEKIKGGKPCLIHGMITYNIV